MNETNNGQYLMIDREALQELLDMATRNAQPVQEEITRRPISKYAQNNKNRILEALAARYPTKEIPYGSFSKIARELGVDDRAVGRHARANGYELVHATSTRLGRRDETPKIPDAFMLRKYNEGQREIEKQQQAAFEKDALDTINGLLKALGRSERIGEELAEQEVRPKTQHPPRRPRAKTTLTLTCDGCGVEFERSISQYNYARKQSPLPPEQVKNFHNRDCYMHNSLEPMNQERAMRGLPPMEKYVPERIVPESTPEERFTGRWEKKGDPIMELTCTGCGVNFERAKRWIDWARKSSRYPNEMRWYHDRACFYAKGAFSIDGTEVRGRANEKQLASTNSHTTRKPVSTTKKGLNNSLKRALDSWISSRNQGTS